MSGKLDQSLDDIVKVRRQTARRTGRGARRTVGSKSQTVATVPVGGVTKTTRAAKSATKAAVPTAPAFGESKIIVSGLPSDVTDTQIKEYFGKTIGPVRRVFLTYGPNGQSKGIATITFNKSGSAAEAAAQLNGVKVDNRAMKIEVVVSASQAPVAVPAKALGERIVQPKSAAKSQPKPASAVRAATTAGKRGRVARRGRNAGRGKPKSAEELDAEMVDYFDANAAATQTNGATMTNGAAPAASSGDTGMDDDIL